MSVAPENSTMYAVEPKGRIQHASDVREQQYWSAVATGEEASLVWGGIQFVIEKDGKFTVIESCTPPPTSHN